MVADVPADLRPLILVVEDNPQDVQLLKLALAPYGDRIAFQWAPNTISALLFLGKRGQFQHAETPDLILLDLKLPISSGHELLLDIAQDDDWKRIPVVVLSGSRREDDIDRSYREGAMLYVVKPTLWDRWTDLATMFAKLVGLPHDEANPPSGRIVRSDAPKRDHGDQ